MPLNKRRKKQEKRISHDRLHLGYSVALNITMVIELSVDRNKICICVCRHINNKFTKDLFLRCHLHHLLHYSAIVYHCFLHVDCYQGLDSATTTMQPGQKPKV